MNQNNQSRLVALDFSHDIKRLTADFTGREWLFEEIDQWLHHSDQRFFILTGEPGVGKSAIAARLTQMRPQSIAAYHFCVVGNVGTITPNTILRSLAAHLGKSLPKYGEALANTIKPHQVSVNIQQQVEKVETGAKVVGVVINHLVASNPEEELDILLRAPLAALEPPNTPTFILIDSLDEAMTYQGQPTLIHLLAKANDLPPWVRFVCTTRQEGVILSYFKPFAPYLLEAESQANVADIERYVAYRLGQAPMQERLQVAPVTPLKLTERLIFLADGNFLYLKILLNDIEAGRQSLESLEMLPRSMDEIYHRFLRRFTDEQWNERYQPVLGKLAVAREPLSEAQLANLTAISPRQVRQHLAVLEQYLDIVSDELDSKHYRLFHQSLRDYLLAQNRSGLFWCDAREEHEKIGRYYTETYQGNWSNCDWYGLQHTPTHIVEAVRQMSQPEQKPQRKRLIATLTDLFNNMDFTEAKTGRLGVYTVLDDLRADLSRLSTVGEVQPDLIDWLRVLDREAHNLLTWDAKQFPAFFAQQTHNQAVELQLADLVTVAAQRLARLDKPYLALRFRVFNESPALLRTLSGHANGVEKIIAAPDNVHLLSVSKDCLKVWNLETGQEIHSMDGEWDPIGFTKDGNQAILSSNGTLTFWEWSTAQLVRAVPGSGEWERGLAVTNSGNFALCAAQDHKLRLVDLATGSVVRKFSGPVDSIKHLVATPDDRYVIVATWRSGESSDESQLQMWELGSGQQASDFVFDTLRIGGVAVMPDGRFLIASYELYSWDRELKVWDLQTRREVQALPINDYLGNMVVTPDSRYIIVAGTSEPGNLRIWDSQTWQEVASFAAHSYPITSITITPNGRYVISAQLELKVWDLPAILSRQGQSLVGHQSEPVWLRALTRDGRFAILTSKDNALKVWDLDVQQQLYDSLVGHTDIVRTTIVTSDGRYAISSSWTDSPFVWDLKLGQKLHTLEGHRKSVEALTLIPGDRYVVSGAEDVRVWDLQTGQPVNDPLSIGDEVQAVAVTPDGRRLVAASLKALTVFDLETYRPFYTLDALVESIAKLVFTPDGRYAFSIGYYDNSIGVYDLDKGETLPSLTDHSDWVRNVAVTSDSRYAISASNDGTLRVLDLTTRQTTLVLEGHTDWVYDMVLTEDNRRVFSASQDRTVRVWDWRTGETLAIAALAGILEAVEVAQDGRTLAVQERAGSVYFLEYVEPAHLDE